MSTAALVLTVGILSGVSEVPVPTQCISFTVGNYVGRCVTEVQQTPIFKNTIRLDYPAYEYYIGHMDLYPDTLIQELPKRAIPANSMFLPLVDSKADYLAPQGCYNGDFNQCLILPSTF